MSMSSINNAIEKNYERLASGRRINSAADDASGLAISEKLLSQINGFDKGTDNTLDMKNLVRTAEGGLSTISDSLQRMRELALQAKSGILTDGDKAILQHEVDQLKDHIKNSADYTEFNRIKLLDGNFVNQNTASYPDGTGKKIAIDNATLAALGIENFDLTGDFDIADIDNAIDKVNASRAKIGATENALDYTVSFNTTASANLASARSRITDADMAKEISEMSKNQILMRYQMFALKNQNEMANKSLIMTKGLLA